MKKRHLIPKSIYIICSHTNPMQTKYLQEIFDLQIVDKIKLSSFYSCTRLQHDWDNVLCFQEPCSNLRTPILPKVTFGIHGMKSMIEWEKLCVEGDECDTILVQLGHRGWRNQWLKIRWSVGNASTHYRYCAWTMDQPCILPHSCNFCATSIYTLSPFSQLFNLGQSAGFNSYKLNPKIH